MPFEFNLLNAMLNNAQCNARFSSQSPEVIHFVIQRDANFDANIYQMNVSFVWVVRLMSKNPFQLFSIHCVHTAYNEFLFLLYINVRKYSSAFRYSTSVRVFVPEATQNIHLNFG